MKKVIFSVIAFSAMISFNSAQAQVATYQGYSSMSGGVKNNMSRVMTDGYNVRYVDSDKNVEGSPFIFENWLSGKVVFTNGQSGDAEKLNYDALDNVLVTQREGVEMLFNEPIKEFELLDPKEGKKLFRKVNDKFYEVLADGNTKLLKLYTKAAIESIPYGASKPVVKISDEPQYFVIGDSNEFVSVKKDKSLLNIFAKNKKEVENYVKAESINFKKDEDLKKLFNYYNGL